MRNINTQCPRFDEAGAFELYGVVGYPLGQSLSPLVHNSGFKALQITAVYLRWEIAPERLPAFVDSVRLLGIRGCSVTIPHKVPLLDLLDEVSEPAQAIGAVNTLYWRKDNLCGENTDITGFLAPLFEMPLEMLDVLLLGAGGAARAVAAGLHLRNTRRVFVATPSDSTHLPLAEQFDLAPLCWHERHDVPVHLVINTTPLGMRGKYEDESPYDFMAAARPSDNVTQSAYDIVYNPLKTRFLREAAQAGWRCISGLDMFYGQAGAQFRLWTGQDLPASVFSCLRNASEG